MALTTSTIVSIALTVASAVYQAREKRKAKKKAKEEADARKGFEVTTEGESASLAVVYGRAKLAGARVFHNVNGYYSHYAAPRAFAVGLGASRNMGKNIMMYVQQAVARHPLHEIYDATIDGQDLDTKELQHGYRINCYLDGSFVDPMAVGADSARANAYFTGIPYLSMAFKLNRDDPQYGGVPEVVGFYEGAKIRSITKSGSTYSLTATRSYSNNPALVLLDYLLSAEYGRGLPESEVDLESFYNARLVCDKIVAPYTKCGGRIWAKKGMTHRDLPLYECNIVIDPAKPIRDNIIEILSTMGDANLVWSGGKYKLVLQYADSIEDIVVAATLTDENLANRTVTVKYPTASERLNICTVKFADEANDFKENSVTWPPKGGLIHQALLEQDSNIPLEKTYTEAGIIDYYHALAKAEELVRVSRSTVTYQFNALIQSTLLEPGDIIRVDSTDAGINDEYMMIQEISVKEDSTAEITATKYDPTQLAWNAKDDQIVPPRNNYDFDYGIIDKNTIQFIAAVGDELGDTLGRFAWDAPDGYVPQMYKVDIRRVGTTNFTTLGTCIEPSIDVFTLKAGTYEVSIRAMYSGGRFTAAVISNPLLVNSIPSPTGVTFTPAVTVQLNKSGTVKWNKVNDARVVGYNIYVYKVGDLDANYDPIWDQVGQTTGTSYVIPELDTVNIIVGVTAVTRVGAESAKGLSGTIAINYPTPPAPASLQVVAHGTQSQSVKVSWVIPELRGDGSRYNDHYIARIYRKLTTGGTYELAGESSIDSFIDTPTIYGNLTYKVELVSKRAKVSTGVTGTITVSFWTQQTDPWIPPAPLAFNAVAGFASIFLEWDIPLYTNGGGHGKTLIYGKEWPLNEPTQPSFDDTLLIAAVDLSTQYTINAGVGKRWIFWIKEMTAGRAISSSFAGPLIAQTTKIGNSDLGDEVIEARNIADGSINNAQLSDELEAVVYHTGASLPLTNIGNMLSWQNKLYKWSSVQNKYISIVQATEMEGEITRENVADGAITIDKLASISPNRLYDIDSFEQYSVGATPTGSSSGGTSTVTDEMAYHGVRALKHVSSASNSYKYLNPKADDSAGWLKITKNVAYVFSAYVYAQAGAKLQLAAVKREFGTTTSLGGAVVAAVTVAETGWVRLSGEVSITTGTVPSLTFYIRHEDAGVTSYWDCLQVEERGATASPSIWRGGGFTLINGSSIRTGTITADAIGANAITASHISAGAITADKLAAGSIIVGTAVIADGAIENAMIKNATIDAAKIANAAITTAKIDDAAITAAKIADATITTAKIASELKSTNFVANSTGWRITTAGGFELNGSTAGSGRIKLTNQRLDVYDGNGTLRVRVGLL